MFERMGLHSKIDRVLAQLVEIQRVLTSLLAQTRKDILTMAAIDDLIAQVAQNTSVEASAVLALNGVAAQIEAANTANDPKITAALATLKASFAPLASAVAAVPAKPAA